VVPTDSSPGLGHALPALTEGTRDRMPKSGQYIFPNCEAQLTIWTTRNRSVNNAHSELMLVYVAR
jgi:hypothetical protein